MIDSGSGQTQFNNILTSMNIPAMNKDLLKKCERKVGGAIEEVAVECCEENIHFETKKIIEKMNKERE